MVNGITMKIPSYSLNHEDIVQISNNKDSRKIIKDNVKKKISKIKSIEYSIYKKGLPHHLGGNKNLKGKIEH